MKFLKNNVKIIIAFIIGAILATGITVYAVVGANQIDYKNNQKVSDALDDLYLKASTYKNLNTATTATADKILKDYTAYNNNGQLVTGTYTPPTTTQGTEWSHTTGTITSTGLITYDIGFSDPTEILIRVSNGSRSHCSRFVKAANGYTRYQTTVDGTSGGMSSQENQQIMDGTTFQLSLNASKWNGGSFTLIAIKY